MTQRTLKVYANPYHQLDHLGRPSCVLPFEPEGDGVRTFDARRFVGATLKAKVLEKFPPGDPRQNVQENTFEFSDEPTTVKATAYYLGALRRRELIPADAETARYANVKYVDPSELLEKLRAEAVLYWEKVEKHEETSEKAPDHLTGHSFGPMKDRVKKVAEEESKKKAEEAKKAEDAKKAASAGKGDK